MSYLWGDMDRNEPGWPDDREAPDETDEERAYREWCDECYLEDVERQSRR